MGFDKVRNLAELYERYSGPVFGYLLRLSGDRFLADELTGETFYRAMLALDGFRGEASVKTWLLRIAHNLYLRRAEREKRMTSLEALAACGYAADSRFRALAQHIVAKQSDDGRWLKEGGSTAVRIERKGKPSKWITLKALRVIKQAERPRPLRADPPLGLVIRH